MKFFHLSILTVFSITVFSQESLSVFYDNEHITYEGRVIKNKKEKATEIYWSGTSIQLDFQGENIKGIFRDTKTWGGNQNTSFNIFIDGKFKRILELESGKKTYMIASDLSNEKHTLLLNKRNEWTSAKTKFYGFVIEGTKIFSKKQEKELFIEFYGDSVTCGMGNEDPTKEDAITNNYWAYGAITTRNLNAEYSCIARSGIGLMVSWYDLIMPEMYNLTNPYDKTSQWDFSKKQPDVVVINLLQNDSWIVNLPEHKEFKNRFGRKAPSDKKYMRAYANFIRKIQGHYPKTKIICMLGNMDITQSTSKWPALVKEMTKQFEKEVYFLNSPFIPANGHPKVEEHQISADLLTTFIKENILK